MAKRVEGIADIFFSMDAIAPTTTMKQNKSATTYVRVVSMHMKSGIMNLTSHGVYNSRTLPLMHSNLVLTFEEPDVRSFFQLFCRECTEAATKWL